MRLAVRSADTQQFLTCLGRKFHDYLLKGLPHSRCHPAHYSFDPSRGQGSLRGVGCQLVEAGLQLQFVLWGQLGKFIGVIFSRLQCSLCPR
jgi:hypothetical protein